MVTSDKVVVELQAKLDRYNADVLNAQRRFETSMDRVARSSLRAESQVLRTSTAIKGAFAGLAAVFGTRELVRYADTWTDLNSRVALAAGGLEEGSEAMSRLGEIARRTYSDLEQTAESFLSSNTALRELGYTTDQALDFTESLNNALVVSGAKADRAARVIDALSKAMALGKLSGDNLNTVIATGGRAAEALAAGLNTTVGGLRKLGAEGKITGRLLVDSISSQLDILRREADEMPATIGDGFTLLRNAILQYVGEADQATGVSRQISDALVIIADNFDTAADAALKLASVLAGAILGRSIIGMVSRLGLGAKALKEFRTALVAAQGLRGVATAFGSLGAAAGPLGVIIGGAVVGSLALYSSNAAEAAVRSEAFEKELTSLGILAKRTASDIDEAAESIGNISDANKAQKVRAIADEIERLRYGGRFGGAGDELSSIQTRSRGSIFDDGADAAAKREISELTYLLQTMEVTTDEVRKRMEAIRATPISEPVRELSEALDFTASKIEALNVRAQQLGAMPELDAAKEQLNAVINDLDRLEEREIITAEQRRNLEDALTKLRDTGQGADEAKVALDGLSRLSFSTSLVGLDSLIGRVRVLWQEANKASSAIAVALDGGRQSRSSLDPYIQQRKIENDIAADFEKNSIRRAGLTRDQLALENKIIDVRKRLEAEGVTNPEKGLAERIAQMELAAEKLRSEEGKSKGNGRAIVAEESNNDYERLTKSIADRTAAIIAETEAMRQLDPTIEDYGFALEKARAEQELLNAAQKAGVAITPELKEEINLAAEQFAYATAEANNLAEAQDNIRQRAEEWRDTQKDALRGIVDDLIAGKSAADAFASALQKIADKLLDMAFDDLFSGLFKGGGGSGGGIFGSIGKIFGFAEGGYTGSGGKYQPAGVVHRGEYVFDQDSVKRAGGPAALDALRRGLKGYAGGGFVDGGIPSVPSMPSLIPASSGGGSNITFAPVIDARGADSEAVARLAQEMDRQQREFSANVLTTMRRAKATRQWKG